MVGIDLVSGICDVCGCTFEQAEEAGGGGRGGGRTGGRGQTGQTGVRVGGWVVVVVVVVARWMGFVGRVDDGFQGPDADLAVVARGRESLALRGWGKKEERGERTEKRERGREGKERKGGEERGGET